MATMPSGPPDPMCETVRRIIQIRSGGSVERCHGLRHQSSYNNAAHSWGVAMLMHALWPEDFPRLALVCLSHDVAESWVGDIPSPTLTYLSEFRAALSRMEDMLCTSLGLPAEGELNRDDYAKVKACDRLELYLWCREEEAAGNGFVCEYLVELRRCFKETPLLGPAQELFLKLENTSVLPRQAGVLKAAAQNLAERGAIEP